VGKHASSKRGKWRGLLLYLSILLVWRWGGIEIRNLVLWSEGTGQMKALIINIGRRWDDPEGILKRVGSRVHCMRVCVCVVVDMPWLRHA